MEEWLVAFTGADNRLPKVYEVYAENLKTAISEATSNYFLEIDKPIQPKDTLTIIVHRKES